MYWTVNINKFLFTGSPCTCQYFITRSSDIRVVMDVQSASRWLMTRKHSCNFDNHLLLLKHTCSQQTYYNMCIDRFPESSCKYTIMKLLNFLFQYNIMHMCRKSFVQILLYIHIFNRQFITNINKIKYITNIILFIIVC